MDGLNNELKRLQASPELPFLAVGKAINCGFAGRTGGFEKLLMSALRQYRFQDQRNRQFVQVIPALEAYSQSAESSKWQFHPKVVRARCLLWILSEVLELEGKLLFSCSQALGYWGYWSGPKLPNSKSPAFLEKVVTLPLIANIVLWRLTFDVADDVVSFFSDVIPPPEFLGLFFVYSKTQGASAQNFSLKAI